LIARKNAAWVSARLIGTNSEIDGVSPSLELAFGTICDGFGDFFDRSLPAPLMRRAKANLLKWRPRRSGGSRTSQRNSRISSADFSEK